MYKKSFLSVSLLIVFLMFSSKMAQATIILFDNRQDWEKAAGYFVNYDLSTQVSDGQILSAGAPLTLNESLGITFDSALEGRQVPDTWSTWSNGYTPGVLSTINDNSVTGTFTGDYSLGAFGLEMEPNSFSLFNMTMGLNDGSNITRSVNGDGGAAFFGWLSDEPVSSFILSSDDELFAFGRIVYSQTALNTVPEPVSFLLFGLGLTALLVRIKKRK